MALLAPPQPLQAATGRQLRWMGASQGECKPCRRRPRSRQPAAPGSGAQQPSAADPAGGLTVAVGRLLTARPVAPACLLQVQRRQAAAPVARTRTVTKALADVNLVVGGE